MTASDNIDKLISGLDDWRAQAIASLRRLINEADPRLQEDWKWSSPVWAFKGNVCSVGVFKDHLKLNFFKGATIADTDGLFNAGLDAKESRAIDIFAGDAVNEAGVQELVRRAANQNDGKR